MKIPKLSWGINFYSSEICFMFPFIKPVCIATENSPHLSRNKYFLCEEYLSETHNKLEFNSAEVINIKLKS